MLSVDTCRECFDRSRSHSSIASTARRGGTGSTGGIAGITAQSLAFAASNASREPTGKCSTTSLPSRPWQKRHVLNEASSPDCPSVRCDQAFLPGLLRARGLNRFVTAAGADIRTLRQLFCPDAYRYLQE
jgi:hypothetical protein